MYCSMNYLIKRIQRNGWNHTCKMETLVFKLLCEENKVKLIHTPRLTSQIMRFVCKLQAKFSEVCEPNKKLLKVFCNLMMESPPFACKILASEFVHRKDYVQIWQKNHQSEPHPKWIEYENEADFEQPLGLLLTAIEGTVISCQYLSRYNP